MSGRVEATATTLKWPCTNKLACPAPQLKHYKDNEYTQLCLLSN
jgi:hypothetical protein